MSFYFTLKRLFTGAYINAHAVFRTFNLAMNARRVIKLALERIAAKDLSPQQKKIAKDYYKAHGYRLNNTYWHRYYYAMTGEFYADYIPEDIFRSRIAPRLNEQKQWPALLDKNLIYNLFKEFAQPVSVVQNINGFFYVDGKLTHEDAAAEKCRSV